MLCRNPYLDNAGRAFPCGQCMPCRINRRRVWTHRIMLESMMYQSNSFVTLTYGDSKMPVVTSSSPGQPNLIMGTLQPLHLQHWLKRFRKAISPSRIRFYAVGEYGDASERPHYHAALFNFPPCNYGMSQYSKYRRNCCPQCDLIRDTWGHGNIALGTLTTESAQYIAGYVTKKMTSKDDFRLNGRHPEFARMSNRPGIGADFVHEIASTLLELNLEDSEADVPAALRHGNRLLPLGRYMRMKLRKAIGRDEKAPQAVLDALKEELQPLRSAAFDASESFKSALVKASDQKVKQMEARAKIFKKRRQL